MFGDAVRDGLTPINPFAELRLPGSRGRKDIEVLMEDELVALADLALDPRMEVEDYGPQYRAMVLFAGYTGVRPGELFALRRDDVKSQLATVERSLSSKTHTVGPTKTGRSRTIVVPPVAQDALLEVPTNRLGLLFVSPAGVQWSQSLERDTAHVAPGHYGVVTIRKYGRTRDTEVTVSAGQKVEVMIEVKRR